MGVVNYFSTICKTKWHKSGTFLKLPKSQNSIIHWYRWRTSQDLNLEPADQKSDVVGKQGETTTNKNNTTSKFIELHCSHISQNMV